MNAAKLLASEIFDALVEIVEGDPERAKRLVLAVEALAKKDELPPQLLSKEQTAKALNVSIATLDRAVTQGCPVQYVGAKRRFDLEAARAWFKARGKLAAKPSPRHAPENDPIDVELVAKRAGLRPNSH